MNMTRAETEGKKTGKKKKWVVSHWVWGQPFTQGEGRGRKDRKGELLLGYVKVRRSSAKQKEKKKVVRKRMSLRPSQHKGKQFKKKRPLTNRKQPLKEKTEL